MQRGRSSNPHLLGGLLALALLAACWHVQEQAFVNVPPSATSTSRFVSGVHPMSMKVDYTVARSNSVQYIALCATALGAAALLQRKSVRPKHEKPRVVMQAFRMDQAALPEMISRGEVASLQPQAPAAVTRSDLIDCLETPQTYSMANQDTAATAIEPLIEAENLAGEAPAAAPGHNRREGGRQRRERRQVGAKLLRAGCSVEPIPPSFEPSKVSLQLQQAKQLGATPKNISGREVQFLVEAPGLSASQDIGLKSLTRNRATDA